MRAGPKRAPGRDGTAAKIFAAAEALLVERGGDGASMREIADRARINKALIFYHFGSKEGLVEAVLDRYYAAHAQVLERAARAAADGDGAVPARIHRLIDAYLDFMERNRVYPRLVQLELARGRTLERIRRSLVSLFGPFERAIRGLVPSDGPLSAKHFFLTFSSMVVNHFTYGPALDALWREDPLSEVARAERRRHIHWMADAILLRIAPT